MTDADRLDAIFAAIGPTTRWAVDIGARDGGPGSTTWRVRTRDGWRCLLLDALPRTAQVRQAFVTAENVNALLRRHAVPPVIDLLAIDIDGNDYWIWQAMAVTTPRVVVVEYNSSFGPDQRVALPYRAGHRWDKTDYYGASAAALVQLGRARGYTLVDVSPQTNLFFVQDTALVGTTLTACPLPPAAPYGYPHAARQWEAV